MYPLTNDSRGEIFLIRRRVNISYNCIYLILLDMFNFNKTLRRRN